MTDTILNTFGLYGAAFVIAFIAGLFPLISIEVFLIGVARYAPPSPGGIVLMVLLACIGHQLSKTLTYFAGVGALEKGKLRAKVEKFRARIEKWNKRPKLVLFLAAVFGFPPLLLVGFIARPIMQIPFVPFTIVCFAGRVLRFAFLIVVPMLF